MKNSKPCIQLYERDDHNSHVAVVYHGVDDTQKKSWKKTNLFYDHFKTRSLMEQRLEQERLEKLGVF